MLVLTSKLGQEIVIDGGISVKLLSIRNGRIQFGIVARRQIWKRFQQHLCQVPALGLALDVSRMRFEDGFLDRMAGAVGRVGKDAHDPGRRETHPRQTERAARTLQGDCGQ